MNSPSACVRELLHAKLDALLAEFDTVADHAAFGETINDLDAFLLVEGRAFIKEVFEQKLQELIAKKEQTHEATQCTSCKKNANARHESERYSLRSRTYTVRQRYKHCLHCTTRSYPFETELGNDNTYTNPLKSLAARRYDHKPQLLAIKHFMPMV